MIIGLLGKSKSGKDTAAVVLARELGGTCVSFADPIKRFCMKALGLTIDQLWGDDKEKPIIKKQLKAIEPKLQNLVKYEGRVGPWDPVPTPFVNALNDACGQRYVDAEWKAEQRLLAWWSSVKGEKGLTPRRVMQHFGTEYVRTNLGKDFWIKVAWDIAGKVISGEFRYLKQVGTIPVGDLRFSKAPPNDAVIVPDVRFRNEIIALKTRGALVYRVKRFDMIARSGKIDINHASEAEQNSIPSFWVDGVFSNYEGRKDEYEASVKRFAQNLKDKGMRCVV